MRLNIGSLVGRKGASFAVKKEVPSDFMEISPDVDKVLSPVLVQISVTNSGNGYLVAGSLEVEIALNCSRCLKPIQTKIKTDISEEFRTQARQNTEDDLWDEEPVVEANELDLTQLIEESVLMSVPMKAVCESDCPGLCPVCGINLAQETCDCLDPKVDIRLSPLADLLETMESESTERRKDNGSTKEKTFKSKN